MSRTGFLLAEDEALKVRFSSLTVSDDREPTRPVQVFFRYPEGEVERLYPFITLELIDIVYARNRQHSIVDQYLYQEGDDWGDHPSALQYWPSESHSPSVPAGYEYSRTYEFVPVDILYQVSTFTRSALHDRQLSSQILYKILPFRYNSIYIPADNTSRRLDMLDWTTADLLDPESGYRKRIFRKIYTVQMTAELPTTELIGVKQAQSIQTTLVQQ